ncbi:MAG TPA: hypothetical protein VFV72_08465 [Candidatus Limnocylindrales bacterium]|nr:hypothetical protein [Candidatus Limnocylindrales bacterium]
MSGRRLGAVLIVVAAIVGIAVLAGPRIVEPAATPGIDGDEAQGAASPRPSPSSLVASSGPDAGSPTASPRTEGIFISPADLAALPRSGPAYEAVAAAAAPPWPEPDLTNPDSRHQLHVLASALLGDRERARDGIRDALGTFAARHDQGVLALGRQLPAYIVSADLIDLANFDPGLDEALRHDLGLWRNAVVGTHNRWKTLAFTFGDSSNNWGAHAGAAVIAIDRYLGKPLDDDWAIFRGFTGDPDAHRFPQPKIERPTWYGAKTWTPVQVLPNDPRDGAVTEDAWRAGYYPKVSNTYVMDSAQALAVQAELLSRAGYPAWDLLQRSAAFLKREETPWSTKGGRGGETLAYLYNRRLGLGVPTDNVGDRMAWSFGFGDWLYP